jgi:hypothetical protein
MLRNHELTTGPQGKRRILDASCQILDFADYAILLSIYAEKRNAVVFVGGHINAPDWANRVPSSKLFQYQVIHHINV